MENQIEIESHFDGRLKVVYLNHPKTYNALNKSVLSELTRFFSSVNEDNTVRCVAISGRGKAFCSGQNLDDIFETGQTQYQSDVVFKMVQEYYNPLVKALTACRKPVVSLVNGPAVGAGAVLSLICDVVLASDKAYFSQVFSSIGLIPDTGGTYFLPKLMGRQMANYLAFTGKKLPAQEAKAMGLVAEVFNQEDFEKECLMILENISNMPTMALEFTKKAFALSYGNTLEDQLCLEAELQEKAARTEDFFEGVSAFLEKRKPVYKGC